MTRSKKSKLVVITTRLLAADVDELRRRAEAQGVPWQTYLRLIVNRSLKRTEVIS